MKLLGHSFPWGVFRSFRFILNFLIDSVVKEGCSVFALSLASLKIAGIWEYAFGRSYLKSPNILFCFSHQIVLIFAAGAIMEEQAAKHLGVKICKFIPKHSRNLANEFRCYVNYASGLN